MLASTNTLRITLSPSQTVSNVHGIPTAFQGSGLSGFSSLSALFIPLAREYVREPAAEFLGTMILVIFGCGGNCQVVLSSNLAVSASPRGVSPASYPGSTVQR